MDEIKTKEAGILKEEESHAYLIAQELIPKPRLSVWMILIPIIIVFHMYRHKQAIEGRRNFAENYLLTRRRVLSETSLAVAARRGKDINQILEQATDVPEDAMQAYRNWVSALSDHYRALLEAKGNSFDELVRFAFVSKSAYLIEINCLKNHEKAFMEAVSESMDTAEKEELISAIDAYSRRLLREKADLIFP